MKIRYLVGVATMALGTGLALAPAATAQVSSGNGAATIKSTSAGNATRNAVSVTRTSAENGGLPAAAGKAGTVRPLSVSCWNGYTSGRLFHENCSGTSYRPYVDCTNGYRYIFGTFSGSWEHWLYCPAGSNAIWGGAYG